MENFPFGLQIALFVLQAVIMIAITIRSSSLEKQEKDEFMKRA
jgi:hypothetical protein